MSCQEEFWNKFELICNSEGTMEVRAFCTTKSVYYASMISWQKHLELQTKSLQLEDPMFMQQMTNFV